MALVMLLIVLLSSCFIAMHADHDCDEEDCPVCACMQQCENNIRSMAGGLTVVTTVIIPLFAALSFIYSGVPLVIWNTLVSRKVRLND